MTISLRDLAESTLQGPTGPSGPTGTLSTVTSVTVVDASGNALDDTALTTLESGYLQINGTNFLNGCTVSVGDSIATSVTFVNSTAVRCTLPTKPAGTYHVYVTNPNGTIAIGLNAVVYSAPPTWVTTSPLQSANVDFAISRQLSATDAVTYSLAAGSSLPTGLTLSSAGLISGTVTGLSVATTYSFTVLATDAQNQDASRTFSITINVVPSYVPVGTGYNVNDQFGGTNDFFTTFSTFGDKAFIDIGGDGDNWTAIDNVNGDRGRLWWQGGWSNGAWPINDPGGVWTRSSPIQVGSSSNWIRVSGGRSEYGASSGAILAANSSNTYGAIWTWGQVIENYTGAVTRSSPVQVGSDVDWVDLVMGGAGALAFKAKPGTLYGIGLYAGTGIQTQNTSFTAVAQTGGIGTSIISARAGDSSDRTALTSSGGLYYWGSNSVGPMGAGAGNSFLYPTQIATGVSTANDYTHDVNSGTGIFVKADGTLWAWGVYALPAVGNQSTPVQIGSDTDWNKCWCTKWHYFAQKTNGIMYGWGSNNYNQLGLNTEAVQSVPTQLGAQTTWARIVGTARWTIAFR